MKLPKKLKDDAIIEALFEIRFDSNDVGEVIIGRLSDSDFLEGFFIKRLATADIPLSISESNPAFRFNPTLEACSEDERTAIRIGPHVLSYHAYAPYPGWDSLGDKLKSLTEVLFEKSNNLKIERLGFRYINIVRPEKHLINDFNDLTLKVSIDDQQLDSDINIALSNAKSDHHTVITRVACPSFITQKVLKGADVAAIIDIDVYTPDSYQENNMENIFSWLEDAHAFEKESFFSLIPTDIQEKLTEG